MKAAQIKAALELGRRAKLMPPVERPLVGSPAEAANLLMPEMLVGLLMVDLPQEADPLWLRSVANTYGDCPLIPMTSDGKRGLACRMVIEPDSLP